MINSVRRGHSLSHLPLGASYPLQEVEAMIESTCAAQKERAYQVFNEDLKVLKDEVKYIPHG